jgi:hypothetical protein
MAKRRPTERGRLAAPPIVHGLAALRAKGLETLTASAPRQAPGASPWRRRGHLGSAALTVNNSKMSAATQLQESRRRSSPTVGIRPSAKVPSAGQQISEAAAKQANGASSVAKLPCLCGAHIRKNRRARSGMQAVTRFSVSPRLPQFCGVP